MREEAGAQVDEDWEGEADEPEVHEWAVELAGGEDAGGADRAPDYGGCEEDAAVGAGEVVWLVAGADGGDGGEGPVHHGDLDDRGPEAGEHLGGEGDSRGDFHVVAWVG